MSLATRRFHSASSSNRKYFQYERTPYSNINPAALHYQSTPRIDTLAKPKNRRDTTIREGFSRYYSDPTYSGVTPAAANAQCSERLKNLALPLRRFASLQSEWSLPRPVSKDAMRYQATPRLTELASPKKVV